MQTEPNPAELTAPERELIDGLRKRGFAVVVFNPDEVGDADPENLEEILVVRGNNLLLWGTA